MIAAIETSGPSTVTPHVDTETGLQDLGVRVSNAFMRYGDRVVLDGVELHVRPGEIYGLLGANGAGKTTLIKAICGRLKLERGTILIDGKDPSRSKQVRRRIGFVPQDIALFGYLTVRENLRTFARLAGVPRRDVKAVVAHVLARTGLTDFSDRRCATLSGGYRRRLNICASILHKPSILLLDEPTVGIDIAARQAIHTLIKELRDSGTAIILTTHDLEQAEELCDRVGILVAGRTATEGPPEELLDREFEGNTELVAVIKNIDDSVADVLRGLGWQATAAPDTWVLFAPLACIDMPALSQRFHAENIAIKEIRVRKPDLAALFRVFQQRNGGQSTSAVG